MPPILVTLTSHSDPDFERSNISFQENKPDGVDSNSNGSYYCVRKKEEELYGFRQTEKHHRLGKRYFTLTKMKLIGE